MEYRSNNWRSDSLADEDYRQQGAVSDRHLSRHFLFRLPVGVLHQLCRVTVGRKDHRQRVIITIIVVQAAVNILLKIYQMEKCNAKSKNCIEVKRVGRKRNEGIKVAWCNMLNKALCRN